MPNVNREEAERSEYEHRTLLGKLDDMKQTVEDQQEKLQKYDRFVAVLKAAGILSNDQEIAVMKVVGLI